MFQLDLLEAPNLLRSVPRSNQYNTDSHGLLAKFIEDPHPIASHRSKMSRSHVLSPHIVLEIRLTMGKSASTYQYLYRRHSLDQQRH